MQQYIPYSLLCDFFNRNLETYLHMSLCCTRITHAPSAALARPRALCTQYRRESADAAPYTWPYQAINTARVYVCAAWTLSINIACVYICICSEPPKYIRWLWARIPITTISLWQNQAYGHHSCAHLCWRVIGILVITVRKLKSNSNMTCFFSTGMVFFHQPSEILTPLGNLRDYLRAPLTPLDTILSWWS